MGFPAQTIWADSVTDLINDTPKHTFAGSKPFITLTKFIGPGANKLYYGSYSAGATGFDLSKIQNQTERFPPIITGLEVGTSGTLGALKKAKINIKFASMKQFEEHSGFFTIGATQLVKWGWSNNSSVDLVGNDYDIAADIVNNLKNYQKTILGNHTIDVLAGVMVNFSIKLNSDATVDTVVELGSPADIPGYLELNKQTDKTQTVDNENNDSNLVTIAKALDLDGDFAGLSKEKIKAYSVNFAEWSWDHLWTAFSTFGETNQPYIQLGFALDHLCNVGYAKDTNEKSLDFKVDLDQSVCNACKIMISVSENVIFPNEYTMVINHNEEDVNGVRLLTPDPAQGREWGPFNADAESIKWRNAGDTAGDYFPESKAFSIKVPEKGGMKTIKFSGGRGGFVKRIYISTQFLIDSATGSKTINDFLQKIVDELNIAGAGIFDLMIHEGSDSDGKNILTIIDLNLATDYVPTASSGIQLFGSNSRIIDFSLSADLPKEMIGEVLMGNKNDATKQLGTPGSKMFTADLTNDPLKKATYDKTGGIYNAGAKPPKPSNGWWTKFGNKISTFFKNQLNLGGPNLVKFQHQYNFGRIGQTESVFGVYKDVSVVRNTYQKYANIAPKENLIRNKLIPVTVSMTMLGMSGISVGTIVRITPAPAPWLDAMGYWQVTNVEHKVDDTKWETIIEFKYRLPK